MCLFAMDGKEMLNIPAKRADDWVRWITQLRAYDLAAEDRIREAINLEFSRAAMSAAEGNEAVIYSSAIPGKVWRNTAYQPIFDVLQSEIHARLFFGLLVWDVAVHRPDHWYFKPKDSDEREGGTYYFPKTSDLGCEQPSGYSDS